MGLFVKCCGGALLSAILVATVGNRNKDMATVLGLTACCLIAMAGLTYLRPVISFISQLEELGGLDHALISILLKIAGIGILAEIGTLVCNDSGIPYKGSDSHNITAVDKTFVFHKFTY